MKTLEDLVKEQLGALTLQVLSLTAENLQLRSALEPKVPAESSTTSSGGTDGR